MEKNNSYKFGVVGQFGAHDWSFRKGDFQEIATGPYRLSKQVRPAARRFHSSGAASAAGGSPNPAFEMCPPTCYKL